MIERDHNGQFAYSELLNSIILWRKIMFRNSRKFAGLGLALGAFLLLGAAPASAAATTTHLSECQEFTDFTFCAKEQAVDNRVETPSGKLIVQFQIRNVYTVTWFDGTIESSTSTGHAQYVFNPGEMVKYSYHNTNTTTNRSGQTCVYAFDTVFAGGEYRIEELSFTCS